MSNLPEVFMFKTHFETFVAILAESGSYHIEHLEAYNPSIVYTYGGWTERELRANFDNGDWTYLGPVELPDEDVDIGMQNLEEIL